MKELTILRAALAGAYAAHRMEEYAIILAGIRRLFEQADTVKVPALCAWCLAEQHIEVREGDSHGICKRHSDAMKEQSRERRARKLVA